MMNCEYTRCNEKKEEDSRFCKSCLYDYCNNENGKCEFTGCTEKQQCESRYCGFHIFDHKRGGSYGITRYCEIKGCKNESVNTIRYCNKHRTKYCSARFGKMFAEELSKDPNFCPY